MRSFLWRCRIVVALIRVMWATLRVVELETLERPNAAARRERWQKRAEDAISALRHGEPIRQ